MASIDINSTTSTAYPIQVSVSDALGNNTTAVGTIITAPPETFYLPVIFDNAPSVMVTLTDDDGCTEFQIIACT